MKTKNTLVIAVAGALGLIALNGSAQNSPEPYTAGVAQIVQLEQAKVSDDTIIAFIKNSGNSYALNADQIIYLRQQGVSTAIINTMLVQTPANVATATPAPPPVAAAIAPSPVMVSAPPPQPSVVYVQSPPPVKVVQAAPVAYYPAYGYSGWSFPLSFSFAWSSGGGHYSGGHYGGWHH
jgi:hypothetical protein